MRVELPRRPRRPGKLLMTVVFCVVFIYGGRMFAENAGPTVPHTKLVVFADHRIAEDQWAALFAALGKGLTNAADGPPLAADVDLIRGDAPMRGPRAPDSIAVLLQGDCTLMPPKPFGGHEVEGALGWVPRVHGRIEPYVHVDCTLLVQMLGRLGMRLSRERRNTVMGEAIAHVILHEWIHINRQSAAHADHGISQAQFSIADLLADDGEFQPRKRHRHDEKAPRL